MRPVRWTLRPVVLFFLVVAAAQACDCGENAGRLRGTEPVISVDPSSVTLDGVPGRVTETILRVSNVGAGVLKLTAAPAFVEKDNDGATEYGVYSLFEKSCDESPRTGTQRLEIPSGDCAQLVFRYLPSGDGDDSAELHLLSNDPETPDFVVPINAKALTPKLEVCAWDGQTKLGCTSEIPAGATLDVDFGMVTPGSSTVRTLKLTSSGTRPVRIQGLNLSGDADFTVTPPTLDTSLENGQGAEVTATFAPLTGGNRTATLTISNDDPTAPMLPIRLIGVGDASRVCLCVGAAGERCVPTSVADFGQVSLGGEGKKFVRLASCGTKPLILRQAEVTEGGPVFTGAATNLGGGLAMSNVAGDPSRELEIPLSFKPVTEDRFVGKFSFRTDAEQGYVNLVGNGIPSGCKLDTASPVLDFGQVARGIESRRELVVANRGTSTCLIPSGASITSGANVSFAVVAVPAATTIDPGQTVRFGVAYTPQDIAGPDAGEVSIPYGDAVGGVATSSLVVPLAGTPVAEPKCVLVASPGRAGSRKLNFGQVRTNSEKVLPVTLQNTGSAQCTLNSWNVSGFAAPGSPNDAGFFRIKTPPKALLQPGETTALEVAFTPTSDRAYGSPFGGGGGLPIGGNTFGVNLLVKTSDLVSFSGQDCSGFTGSGPAGCVGWALSGTGVKSDLQVLPGDIDFGKVTLGCRSREERITLYNTGQAVVNIKSVTVDPAPPPEIFKAVTPALPLQLAGGAQITFTVRYKPPAVGIHTGTLSIESDATNVSGSNPFITVGLRGEGTTDSRQTDTFDQSTRPKTDVLFVVDNSGSMSEEQGRLASNASRFIGVAQQLNTDFQIAVITTDMDASNQSGKFMGSPKIITNGTSAASQLATTVRALGTGGSSDEKGLAAMVAALTDPLINDANNNRGFLRPDAKLAVVVVSDEEDYSSANVDFYVDFLKNIKGQYNAAMVSLSAIVGDANGQNSSGQPGCTSADGDAVEGSRYIAVQQRTSGQFRSICSSDWGQVAADIGLDAFASRSGFPLSRVADPTSIRVTVNGTVSPASNWTYDPAANMVVFNPTSLPAAGATVVIEYDTLCL